MEKKVLPIWYDKVLNDILLQATQKYLSGLDPEKSFIIIMCGSFENHQSLTRLVVHDNQTVANIIKLLADELCDLMTKEGVRLL